jgi:hypothetical protein
LTTTHRLSRPSMRIHVVPTVNVRPTPLVGSTVAVALRYLTFQLAHLARPTWWPLINLPEYAPDTRLQDDDEGPRLRWDDDWLHFRAGGPRNGQRASSAG